MTIDKPPGYGDQQMTTTGLAMIYVGGFLVYADSELTAPKLGAYALALAGLALLLLSSTGFSRPRLMVAATFCFGYSLSTLASMMAATTVAGPAQVLQELLYPAVLLGSSLVMWRVVHVCRTVLRLLVLGLASANFFAAFLASLGFIKSVPLLGDIMTGRVIFGTAIPSSAGLTFNVNYFAVSQGCFLLLYGLLTHLGSSWRARDRMILCLLFFSSLWGSSRGVLLSLAVAGGAILLITALWGPPGSARRAGLLLACVALVVGTLVTVYFEQVYDIFRLAKGLNERDIIWSEGIGLWLRKPVLGWGLDVDIAQRFAADRLPEGVSFHSGYLHTLVRGGLALFVFSFGFVVAGAFWGLGFSGRLWFEYRWAVAIIVYYLVNAAFRTYSLGGMGLLPTLTVTAVSMCLYARVGGGSTAVGFRGHLADKLP